MSTVNTIVTIQELQPTRKHSFKAFRSFKPAQTYMSKRAEKYGKALAGRMRFVDYSVYSHNPKDKRYIVNV